MVIGSEEKEPSRKSEIGSRFWRGRDLKTPISVAAKMAWELGVANFPYHRGDSKG